RRCHRSPHVFAWSLAAMGALPVTGIPEGSTLAAGPGKAKRE
ncbi:MAG: hypothetical protein QOC80_115, partial [Frankiaceae bacterium]|nr:hypothetical protein [Frankiaceae bacterium]